MSASNDQSNPASAVPVWIASAPASSFAVVTGQQATTAAAVQLASNKVAHQVTLTARAGNAATLAIGGAGVTLATGYPLAPGASVTLSVANTNLLYLIGANTTDHLDFIGY